MISPKAAAAHASRPRAGLPPIRRRGRIQYATPSANCTSQPTSTTSTCAPSSHHGHAAPPAGGSTRQPGSPLAARMAAPSVTPTPRCASAVRTIQTLRRGT
ncbi:hypothetical protein DCC79_12575 [bacterium]|nr:MAG: hypothetical protein DCC79_12575 [bacterium]